MRQTAEIEFGNSTISIETGRLARQANGSVTVRNGGTVVITTATGSFDQKKDMGFFPLTVDYREKKYAAGKIPGGFFKREGPPSQRETLTCRLVDRPIRPLFADGYNSPTHLVTFVISHDQEHESDLLAILGSSCALMVSDIPFLGPVSPVRVGRINGELIANPTIKQQEECDLNITVVCSETSIVMVEGGADSVPEEVIVDVLTFAFETAQPLNRMQRELAEKVGKPKHVFTKAEIVWVTPDGETVDPDPIFSSFQDQLLTALQTKDKLEMNGQVSAIKEAIATKFDLTVPGLENAFRDKFKDLEKNVARGLILREKRRNDGRKTDEIRAIWSDIDELPLAHGSAVFTRGQTQALVAITLGTTMDEQKIDGIEGESYKSFMLHYNFPPFSVGETGFLRGPGRREIGHGALAERAIQPVLPAAEEFPYTIRVVSDILESNGSSSMASVCGATLSLMDGGVPIKNPVAGIAMGLVMEGDDYAVLSDISGLEDHLGDMDFKVAGTKDGITAIQMDIKLTGFDQSILVEALSQARVGRLHILNEMLKTIDEPRKELKPHAPRIQTIKINPEKIGAVVGPGGKIIRALSAETGASIEINDDGTVKIASSNAESLKMATERIKALTEEAEVGRDYTGTVRRIESYGAFIEILPGTDGLLHISRMADYRVREVEDVMNMGDKVLIRVVEIDRMGKVKLSRTELIQEGKVVSKRPAYADSDSESDRGSGGDRGSRDSRGGRDSRPYRGDRPRRDDRSGRSDRSPREDRPDDRPNPPPRPRKPPRDREDG